MAHSVLDRDEVLHESTKVFQGSATSPVQPSALNSTQHTMMQKPQHLLQGPGGRDQGMEINESKWTVENIDEHASRGADFNSFSPSANIPVKPSSHSPLSHRPPASNTTHPSGLVTSSSPWLPDGHEAQISSPLPLYPNSERQNGPSHTVSLLHLSHSLSRLNVNLNASSATNNSPIRKLPPIPPSPSMQLNNKPFVSPVSNSAPKLAAVSTPNSEISQTPISARSPKKAQQTTGVPGGVSASIGTAVGGYMDAYPEPLGSLVIDVGRTAAQDNLPVLPSPSSTSMSVVSGSGPSTGLLSTANSPAQPVSILKNKPARHPSGSSLSVSMTLPPFHAGAASSSSTYLASTSYTVRPPPSSPPSSFLSNSTSTISPSTQLSSTASPQSTTTLSSNSAFSFSPHPGSATSSVATSPAVSPSATENAEMSFSSLQSNVTNNPNPIPISSKSKGKQKEVYAPDDFKGSIRPLPRLPPVGIGGGEIGSTGLAGPVGVSGASLMKVSSATSSTRTSTNTSVGPSSVPSSARSSFANSLFQGTSSSSTISPLRPALQSSFSSSSLPSRHASSSSSKGKLSRPANSNAFGPPPSSSSSSNYPASTSSAKSPIPSSWASRPVDLHSQRPPQLNMQHGSSSLTTSYAQLPPQAQQSSTQSRARISSALGTMPTSTTTSVPVLAYGNRSRSGSGSMGVGVPGLAGVGSSKNVIGGRARSHSRTRTGAGMMSVGVAPLSGTSGAIRAASREREVGSGASLLKSMSVPSTPVMKSMQVAFLAGSGIMDSVTGMSTSSTTPLSSRLPRALPSPVLQSRSLSNFALSGSDILPAKPIPRRTATFDQIVIASGSGIGHSTISANSPARPALLPASSIHRSHVRREPSLPRHNAATSSRNASPSPRRLPQPSLAAHIASISASSSPTPHMSSSAPPSTLAFTSLSDHPSSQVLLPNVVPAIQRITIPNTTTTTSSASPITPESPLHSHPFMGELSSREKDDDDRSSLSSFRAAPRGRGSGSDLEGLSDHYNRPSNIIAHDEGSSAKEVYDHRDHLTGHVGAYDDLSRSPSPMRYARPEKLEGFFSSSEEEELGVRGRGRGRRRKEGGVRPPVTVSVSITTDSDAAPSESGDADESLGGYSDGEVTRGRRRTQPRAFRNSYRTGPVVMETDLEGGFKAPPLNPVEDGGQTKEGDRLWRISRTKTKPKTKDGDMDKVIKVKDKAKDKAKKPKTKRSYFDFDFDYMPNFKDRERDAGSRTTSSLGMSSRGTAANDSKPNSRPSSPANHSVQNQSKGGTLSTEEPRGTLHSEPSDLVEKTTIFNIGSLIPNPISAAAAFSKTSLNAGNTTTTDSSPSMSSYSPKITSRSGLPPHSPYSGQSNFDKPDSIPGKQAYMLATSSTSSVPNVPYIPPVPPFLPPRPNRLPGSAPASPHPRQLDFQQNSAYALEMETHGISCGLGAAGPSLQRGSETSSAQSSQANNQDISEHSSSSRGHQIAMSASNPAIRNSGKVSAPFSVFGLSRRGSAMFREKDRDRDSGGVKLKEKTKKAQRNTGTSSAGSSRKASSLASLFVDPVSGQDGHEPSLRADASGVGG